MICKSIRYLAFVVPLRLCFWNAVSLFPSCRVRNICHLELPSFGVKARHLKLSASYTRRRLGQLCWISWIMYRFFPRPSRCCWPPNWSSLTTFLLVGSRPFDFKAPIWEVMHLCNFSLFFFLLMENVWVFYPVPDEMIPSPINFRNRRNCCKSFPFFSWEACSIWVASFWHSISFVGRAQLSSCVFVLIFQSSGIVWI